MFFPSRGSLVNSHLALPAIAEKADQEVVKVDTERGVMEVIKEMMNFSLLTNPLFLLIGISNAFGMIGFYTPFVYLPSMAAQFVGPIIVVSVIISTCSPPG